MRFILLFLFALASYADFAETEVQTPQQQYKKARKQFILEYTVFGLDECLKSNSDKLVTDYANKKAGQVVVGSNGYFMMLSQCFSRLKKLCPGEKCIVSTSMGKRIENVRHVDYLLSKYGTNTPHRRRSGLNVQQIKKQQISRMTKFKNDRRIASRGEIIEEFVINENLTDSSLVEEVIGFNDSSEEVIDINPEIIEEIQVTEYDSKENIRKIASLNIFNIEEEEDDEEEASAPLRLFD